MVTDLTQLGYVNNYDKNRYLEIFSKAAVLPSALSSGVAPEFLGYKLFSVHHGTSSYPFGLQKTEFLLLSCSARSLACHGACFGLSYKYCCSQPSLIQS